MSKLLNIINGWKNHLFPAENVRDEINAISESRLSWCRKCTFNPAGENIKLSDKCVSCGCFLIPKSKSMDDECPIGKWGPVLSTEDSNDLENRLNEDNGEQGSI